MSDVPHDLRTAGCGLFNRKLRWSLSARGWICLFVGLVALGFLFIIGVHSFLATNRPVSADTLIVEGWVADYAIAAAVNEFNKGGYKRVIATGGPVRSWRYASQFGGTYAGYAGNRLICAGLSTNFVITTPAAAASKNRTYKSAIAARDWLKGNDPELKAINVVTVGPHARRTRLAYTRAFGPEVNVGIIMIPDEDYDSKRWWQSSAGVRDVISESLGYLQTRVALSTE
jgi:hypothetical protein